MPKPLNYEGILKQVKKVIKKTYENKGNQGEIAEMVKLNNWSEEIKKRLKEKNAVVIESNIVGGLRQDVVQRILEIAKIDFVELRLYEAKDMEVFEDYCKGALANNSVMQINGIERLTEQEQTQIAQTIKELNVNLVVMASKRKSIAQSLKKQAGILHINI